MNHFRYQAVDTEGREQKGLVAARDRDEARAQLLGRGLTPIDLEIDPTFRAPLSEREVTELIEQLHTMTRSGLPLPSGLRAASGELESARLRGTFLRLADHLDRGGSLDSALLDEAAQFPAQLRGVVLAGVRTGRLADVLGEVVQGSNLGHQLRRRVWASLAYPAVILATIMALTSFICHLMNEGIGGTWMGIFRDFGIERPATLIVVMEVTQFIAAYDLWFALALLATGLAGFVIWRFAVGPPRRRRFLESIPLYGSLLRFVAMAEFCHLTALLVEAETPLPEALNLAGGSVRDASLADHCRRVAARVADGEPLASSLRLWDGLPASLGQLLAWGEEGSDLAGALRFAGDMFETRAATQAMFSSQVAGAILLVLIFWWIGFAVAAVYLPVVYSIQLISKLAG